MIRPRAQQARIKAVTVPAPLGGINTIAAGAAMPAEDCVALWNMVPAEFGLRTRLGYREWAVGLDGPVLSLLPFYGASSPQNRLFACTSSGIWDVTSSAAAPQQVFTFATQNADSGWGNATAYVTAAGHFLVYADEANGAFVYSAASGSWTQFSVVGTLADTGVGRVTAAPGVEPPDPSSWAFVAPWKNRLFFCERASGRAWYLDVNSLGGYAYPLHLGNRFKAGGDLRCLASWTYDGGSGIDDALVAVSGGGDVLVYKGTDPANASTFALSGVWFVGSVPAGRRITTDTGGDLLLLTSIGILSLAQLTSGSLVTSTQYQTFKVGNLFNQCQVQTASLRGWAARLHPQDNTLMVLVPQGPGASSTQLVMSTLTKSWSQYRNLPVGVCAEPFAGTLFFGTDDGRVCANDGYLDGVAQDGTGGSPIEFSLISSFSDLGTPSQKRLHFLRPTFLSQGAPPQFNAVARFRWDMSEAPVPPPSTVTAGAAFDAAQFDQAVFAGSYQALQRTFGASGMAPQVALAIAGSASSRMTLVSVEVGYEEGGLL